METVSSESNISNFRVGNVCDKNESDNEMYWAEDCNCIRVIFEEWLGNESEHLCEQYRCKELYNEFIPALNGLCVIFQGFILRRFLFLLCIEDVFDVYDEPVSIIVFTNITNLSYKSNHLDDEQQNTNTELQNVLFRLKPYYDGAYRSALYGIIGINQITSLMVVYSTVYSDADQRKHQSSASVAFVWGIHRDRWIPRTKGQLRGKCFHLMTSSRQQIFANNHTQFR